MFTAKTNQINTNRVNLKRNNEVLVLGYIIQLYR